MKGRGSRQDWQREKSDCDAVLTKAWPSPWGALEGAHMLVTVGPWWGQAFKPFCDSLLGMGFSGKDVSLGRMGLCNWRNKKGLGGSSQRPDPFRTHWPSGNNNRIDLPGGCNN